LPPSWSPRSRCAGEGPGEGVIAPNGIAAFLVPPLPLGGGGGVAAPYSI
jgi:hypothetical protein